VPGASLFTLLDDVASVLDDVALLTKTATQKTAGVLGDDLALNAQQVAGVAADRELSVVWAVARGSAINKLFLVPAALAISALMPWAITPLLMMGGLFLCYEGVEKILHARHKKEHDGDAHRPKLEEIANPAVDVVALEREKIRGAIRTDIVLSAEIIVITLGTVAEASFGTRVAVLCAIAVIMTVGVYGFVAGIVKLDDAGLALSRRSSHAAQALGRGLLAAAPYLMKGLSIAGTIAMFLVGGGILAHGIPPVHHLAESFREHGGVASWLVPPLLDGVTGLVGGALAVAVMAIIQRFRRGKAKAEH